MKYIEILVLFGLVCSFHFNDASKLVFSVSPPEIKRNITEAASMRCEVLDTNTRRAASSDVDVRLLSSIYVTRGDVDVATVTAFDAAAGLVDPGNLMVKGSISGVNGEGVLELTWAEPGSITGGDYTCTVNAVDARGHAVVLDADVEVAVVDATLMDMVVDINKKLQQQQVDFANQLKHEQVLEQKINELEQAKQQQEQTNKKQEQKTNQLEQTIQLQEQNISKLQQDNLAQDHTIKELNERLKGCSRKVAFQAALSSVTAVSPNNPFVYDVTMLNEGNAYDNITGSFTCPHAGLYAFDAHVHSDSSSGDDVRANMKLNGVTMVSVCYKDVYESDSMSAVVHLKVGDVVRVVSYGGSTLYQSSGLGSDFPRLNTFNGYLLTADDCKI